MRFRSHTLLQMLLVAAVFVATAVAFEITPVGTIDDNLFAPTSLHVQDDELAVLEPYSQHLKVFSADGVLTYQVYLTGDAYGLTKVSRYLYLYCDRDRGRVVAINAADGDQYDYFQDVPELQAPIDLLLKDSTVCVLDEASSTIFVLNQKNGDQRQIPLLDPDGERIEHFNSFAYDSARDRYYLLDQVSSRILVVDGSGHQINAFSGFGGGEGEITRGGEVAVDGDGAVYVTDRFQGTVSVFSPAGVYRGQVDAFDGAVAVPTGIAVDDNGILYIASTMGLGIRMFFVSAAPSLDEAVTVVQRYPEDKATLAVEDVRMAAYAELGEDAPAVTGFDFQLYLDTLEGPIAEGSEIEPEDESPEGQTDTYVAGTWTPDTELKSGQTFNWRLRVRNGSELGQWTDFLAFNTLALPKEYQLEQNFPNPFNPNTRIAFTLPAEKKVTIEVINMLGQLVAVLVDETLPAGSHTVMWDGTNDAGQAVATGVYFYRLHTVDFAQTRKMVLIK